MSKVLHIRNNMLIFDIQIYLMSENKKIRNTTPFEAYGINFRSKLEGRLYKVFADNGLTPKYEEITFNILSGFYPKIPFYDVYYDKKLKKKVYGRSTYKVQDITYTPDFTLMIDDILYIIEVKGKENDVFPFKKKLFRKWMEGYCKLTDRKMAYFEIFNKKQALETINLIKNNEIKFNSENGEIDEQSS